MVEDLVQSWHGIRVRYCVPPSLADMYCTKPIYNLPGLPLLLSISYSPLMHPMYTFFFYENASMPKYSLAFLLYKSDND